MSLDEMTLYGVYIFAADCLGLSSLKLLPSAPKDAYFLKRVRIGRSRSPKVNTFGTNRKRICDFLLVRRSLWSYLALFLWYGDLLAKKLPIFLPLSDSAPSLPMFPLEFRGKVKHEETRVMPWAILPWRPHDRSLSHFDMIPAGAVTDRRTDGIYHIANTALCIGIASYADAL